MHQFRFYLPPESINQNPVIMTGADAHHAVNVLRLKAGDLLIIFDGIESEYSAKILSIKRSELILSEIKELRKQKSRKPEIELYSALMPRFDEIIESATELGVSRIFPMLTDRTQIRITPTLLERKLERWKRIAISASMQCDRILLPEISEPLLFSEALDKICINRLGFIANLNERSKTILDALCDIDQNSSHIAVFIGPPADFTSKELDDAKEAGLLSVRLAPNTLRSETAAVSALAVISSFFYTRSLQ